MTTERHAGTGGLLRDEAGPSSAGGRQAPLPGPPDAVTPESDQDEAALRAELEAMVEAWVASAPRTIEGGARRGAPQPGASEAPFGSAAGMDDRPERVTIALSLGLVAAGWGLAAWAWCWG